MAKLDKRPRSMALYETILKLKDLDECCRFFDDLCTPTELRSLEQRFDVAVYLQRGWSIWTFWKRPAPAAPPSAGSAGPCWTTAPEGSCRRSSSGRAWETRRKRNKSADV